jgi:hypothetical protein
MREVWKQKAGYGKVWVPNSHVRVALGDGARAGDDP